MVAIRKLTPALGAEATGIDLNRDLDDDALAILKEAWRAHLVLVVHDQTLSDPGLLAVARRFGELDGYGKPGGPYNVPGYPDVLIVSNVVENGRPIGVLGASEAEWHTDRSFVAAPPSASLLYALELPETGGDTSFLDMHAAYETLPAELKREIDGRSLYHGNQFSSAGTPRGGTAGRAGAGKNHPIVIRHPETGRPALYLGRRIEASVHAMSEEEGDALLDRLWAHCASCDAVYRHRWRVGDLVMWDNRAVMHRRETFDDAARRVMHRTELKGAPPVAA